MAQLSNRLPDENSSDRSHNSSAGLLLPDEEEGDEENCRPASLALLLECFMSMFPVAPQAIGPAFHQTISCLRGCGLVQESSQGLPISPGFTMFDSPVHALSRGLSRDSVREIVILDYALNLKRS